MKPIYFFFNLSLLLLNQGLGQNTYIKDCLNGDWVLSYNFSSYDGPGIRTTYFLKEFDTFRIISFNRDSSTFVIRENNEILLQGKFKIGFHQYHNFEQIRIILVENKCRDINNELFFTHLKYEYLMLNKSFELVSKGYMPGTCTSWDNYTKLGTGFLKAELSRKNRKLIQKLVKNRKQIWHHRKALDANKNIENQLN